MFIFCAATKSGPDEKQPVRKPEETAVFDPDKAPGDGEELLPWPEGGNGVQPDSGRAA